ncbi:MAG: choice-of-anchor D domain-containing protein, partial [Deltaproteobacteria bacterium]|nr:choice-of-anchor D domain-containing protein [Deltaproteobacteria bacterium]
MFKNALIIFGTLAVLSAAILFSQCSGDVSSMLEDTGGNQKPCKNSAQCDKDESCVNNFCVKKDGGTITTCRNSTDCNSDEECINSVCQKKSVDGGVEEVVSDVTPVESTKCKYNSECPEGFICNPESSTCVPGGRIKVDPDKIDFGSVQFGQSVKKTVVITNIGYGPLTIYLVDFETNTNPDPDHPRFTKATEKNIPAILQPNDTMNVDVTYKQDDAQPDNGFLVINSSDITNPSIKVFMSSRYKKNPDLVIVDRSSTPPKLLYPQSGATTSYGIDLGNIPVGNTKEMIVTLLNQSEDGIIAIK